MGKINDEGTSTPNGEDKLLGSDQSSTPAGGTANFEIDDIDDYFSTKRLGNVPTTPNDIGVAGSYAVDIDAVYFCIAENTWRRALITTW